MRTFLNNLALSAGLGLLCFSCAFGRTQSGMATAPEKYLMSAGTRVPSSMPRGHQEVSEPVMPVLYGRDGSPVAVQRGGTVDPGRKPTHDIDSADGSRMYILELYQQAIDAKESLELEVEALNAALDKANDVIEQNEGRISELQTLLETMRADVIRLQAEGDDLASRLTTAQIRRLEAEKLLLEAKLEWRRLQKMMEDRAEDIESLPTGGRR